MGADRLGTSVVPVEGAGRRMAGCFGYCHCRNCRKAAGEGVHILGSAEVQAEEQSPDVRGKAVVQLGRRARRRSVIALVVVGGHCLHVECLGEGYASLLTRPVCGFLLHVQRSPKLMTSTTKTGHIPVLARYRQSGATQTMPADLIDND